jgi:hypothetical protein
MRLKRVAADRPIIMGKTENELRQYVAELRNKCEHHYLRAKYIVNGEQVNMDDLIRKLELP